MQMLKCVGAFVLIACCSFVSGSVPSYLSEHVVEGHYWVSWLPLIEKTAIESGPLSGLAFGVKDMIDVENVTTGAGM